MGPQHGPSGDRLCALGGLSRRELDDDEYSPARNVPFWSLNYEAWYYVLFARAAFFRGRRRIVAIGAAALLAGPKILLLFPVWLMGVAAWRWRADLPNGCGWFLVAISLAGLIVLEALGGQQLFWHPGGRWLPPGYSAYDYLIGALVALFVVGLANARLPIPGLWAQNAVRWLAGTSFGLYLLHYPLIDLLGDGHPGTRGRDDPPGARLCARIGRGDWARAPDRAAQEAAEAGLAHRLRCGGREGGGAGPGASQDFLIEAALRLLSGSCPIAARRLAT